MSPLCPERVGDAQLIASFLSATIQTAKQGAQRSMRRLVSIGEMQRGSHFLSSRTPGACVRHPQGGGEACRTEKSVTVPKKQLALLDLGKRSHTTRHNFCV